MGNLQKKCCTTGKKSLAYRGKDGQDTGTAFPGTARIEPSHQVSGMKPARSPPKAPPTMPVGNIYLEAGWLSGASTKQVSDFEEDMRQLPASSNMKDKLLIKVLRCPDPPILAFFRFPGFFFLSIFLAFFVRFPSFSKDLRGSAKKEKPLLFCGKTLAFSKKARVGGLSAECTEVARFLRLRLRIKGRPNGPPGCVFKRGGVSRSGLVLPFLSLFVLFGTFPIFLGFSRFARGWSGDFPDSSLFSFSAHLRAPTRNGSRHNLDLS